MTRLAYVVLTTGLLAFQASPAAAAPHTGKLVPVEASTLPDRGSAPGGPLALDPMQILYTMPNDLPGPNFPVDGFDFGDTGEIDALANIQDTYYEFVVIDAAVLLPSFEGDPPALDAVYWEDPAGANGVIFTQLELYDPNAGPAPDFIQDLDGLDLWGPPMDSTMASGWDANLYSLTGDPGGVSVFYQPEAGAALAYVTRTQVWNAVTALGFTGTESEVDLDALMGFDVDFDGVFAAGDEILFSIRAAANWDGGEVVRLRFVGAPSFLTHGGHLWDTAFDLSTVFGTGTDEVDALEACYDEEAGGGPRPGTGPTEKPEEPVEEDGGPGEGPEPGEPGGGPGGGGDDGDDSNDYDVQQRYVNLTGETGFDLTKVLEGYPKIGTRHHDKFDTSSVIPLTPSGTLIHWQDGSVGAGDSTWACFNVDNRLGVKVIAVYWTDADHNKIDDAGPGVTIFPEETETGETALYIGHHWAEWLGAGWPPIQNEGIGDPMGPITITNTYVAFTDEVRPLAELTEDLYTDPGLSWQPISADAFVYGQGRIHEFGILDPGTVVLFRFRAEGEGRLSEEMLQFVARPVPTGVEDQGGFDTPNTRPLELRTLPNPTHDDTSIRFRVKDRQPVWVDVFDVKGRRIRTLFSRSLPEGLHAVEWDTHDTNGRAVESGVYLIRVRTGDGTEAVERVAVVR